MIKNDFYSSWKLFSFLKYLNFCRDFFSHAEKLFDKKAMVNFKVDDITTW